MWNVVKRNNFPQFHRHSYMLLLSDKALDRKNFKNIFWVKAEYKKKKKLNETKERE